VADDDNGSTIRSETPDVGVGAVGSVSVFFPCYGDATTIGGLVECAAETIDELGIDGDIVVVNDGSPDDAAAVLTAAASRERRLRVVTHEHNRGYGAALRSGFAAADREWVFYTDGDAQYDPSELAVLVAQANDDVDVVQGYKLGRGDNAARRLIGRLYHYFVALLFGLRVRDTDCDFRLIRTSVMRRIDLTESSGVICVELVRKLQDAGARFVEVGVHHYPRAHGSSTFFTPANVARTLRDLVQLRVALARERHETRAPKPVEAPTRRPDWRAVLAPFFLSRALCDSLLVAFGMLRTHGKLLTGFTSWDGRWYQAIALHGYVVPPHTYHHQTPWPFFPLLPALLRAGAATGISVAWVGVVCNHAIFLLALVGIQRLASRYTSSDATRLAVWLAAFGPLSFVFSMLYPSALFIAASVWAFVWVDEHRDLAAGIAVAVAALSRPNGLVVLVVLVFVVGFRLRRVAALALPTATAIGAWMLYNAVDTGDPLRFFDAKRAWHEVTLVGLVSAPTLNATLHLAVAGVAFGVVYAVRKRIPTSWLAYTFLCLAPSLAFGIVGMARYATDAFPPSIAGGVVLERRPASTRRAVFAVLIVSQIAFAFFYITMGRHVI
jgi:GT2 family glycosyltransferase